MNQASGLFTPDFASQHGCAWFEPSATGVRDMGNCGGWSSVAGLPSTRFESWRDLSADVIWWTNLTRMEAWSIADWQRVRPSDLFGLDWSGWMAERATPAELAQAPAITVGISETFARTASVLARWATDHELKPWTWEEGTVPELIASRLGWSGSRQVPSWPEPVMEAAYLEDIKQYHLASTLSTHRRLVLSFPRRQHAAFLFSVPHPDGPWTMLEPGDWPSEPDKVSYWLLQNDKPLLVKAEDIHWLDPDDTIGPLWLGSRGSRFAGADRQPVWLTGSEAGFLSRYAQFSITAAWSAKQWGSTAVPAGFDLEPDDGLADHAFSQDLISACLWRAATTPVREPGSRRRNRVEPRHVWWRAADRQRCFDSALVLARAGYEIAWHGQGQVAILFSPKSDPEHLSAAIAQAGLLLPGLLAKRHEISPDASVDDVVAVDHWIKQKASMQGKLNIDRLVAPWKGPNRVTPILQEAVSHLLKIPAPSQAWSDAWRARLEKQARKSVEKFKKR